MQHIPTYVLVAPFCPIFEIAEKSLLIQDFRYFMSYVGHCSRNLIYLVTYIACVELPYKVEPSDLPLVVGITLFPNQWDSREVSVHTSFGIEFECSSKVPKDQ